MRVLRLAAIYFLIIFAVGFALGAIRVPFLEPRLGVRYAELLEMPVMLLAIFLASRWMVKRFSGQASPGEFLFAGILAMIGVLVADIGVGVGLRGTTLGEVFAGRDPVSGTAYYLALLVFGLLPWFLRRGAR